MDSRGQTGRTITALPIILIVLVMMIGFDVFAGVMSLAKSVPEPPEITGVSGSLEGSLLFEKIEFPEKDFMTGKAFMFGGEDMFVFDAVVLWERQRDFSVPLFDKLFKKALEKLIEGKENYCLYIKRGGIGALATGGFLIYTEPNPLAGEEGQPEYRIWGDVGNQYANEPDLLSVVPYTLDGENKEVAFYYGQCIKTGGKNE